MHGQLRQRADGEDGLELVVDADLDAAGVGVDLRPLRAGQPVALVEPLQLHLRSRSGLLRGQRGVSAGGRRRLRRKLADPLAAHRGVQVRNLQALSREAAAVHGRAVVVRIGQPGPDRARRDPPERLRQRHALSFERLGQAAVVERPVPAGEGVREGDVFEVDFALTSHSRFVLLSALAPSCHSEPQVKKP